MRDWGDVGRLSGGLLPRVEIWATLPTPSRLAPSQLTDLSNTQ